MGGDHGPDVTLPACRSFLDRNADAQLLMVGLPANLRTFSHPRARIIEASEVVGMDDPLEVALRRKKDSSMRVAIQQVKDGAAQAAVSAALADLPDTAGWDAYLAGPETFSDTAAASLRAAGLPKEQIVAAVA